jgi:hypothetical protein
LLFPLRLPFVVPANVGLVLVLVPVWAARVVVGTTCVTAILFLAEKTIEIRATAAQVFFSRLFIGSSRSLSGNVPSLRKADANSVAEYLHRTTYSSC